MACVNSPFPYLFTYDPKHPEIQMTSASTGAYILADSGFDFWYCQFTCHNSFRIYNILHLIPEDILIRIKNKEVFVVLDNGMEPFIRSADSIYQHVITKGIPAEQIIFMTGVANIENHIDKLASTYGTGKIKALWWMAFELALFHTAARKQLDTLILKPYPKKFLNLNRRWRLHRPLLMTLLYDRNLLDQGYVSFGQSDLLQDTWANRWPELERYYQHHPQLSFILENNTSVQNLPPMYLDTTDLITNRANYEGTTDYYYLNSYFSVVSETTYHTGPGHDSVPFFSEKIFKAITCCHPFILVSVPNSLQYLKKLGYLTFSGLINEDYDQELDDGLRMIKIVDEIQRLSNLSGSALESWLVEAKSICDYNYNVLKNKTKFAHELN